MTGPPLDVALLVQLVNAAELEAETAAPGQPMPARIELHLELWRQRRAIVRALARNQRRPRAANSNHVDDDQPELFG